MPKMETVRSFSGLTHLAVHTFYSRRAVSQQHRDCRDDKGGNYKQGIICTLQEEQ